MTRQSLWWNGIRFALAFAIALGASTSGAVRTDPMFPTLNTLCALPGPWANKTAYPLNVHGAATATDGTYAYVFGGNTAGGSVHAESYRYNPVTNAWTQLANMSAGADWLFHAEYGRNGKIYAFGGLGAGTGSTVTRIYDIATNTWSTGAAVPSQIYDYAHVYAEGKIYIIGGAAAGVATATVRTYDVATNTWGTVAPLPQPEFNMVAGLIGNKIYVAGGSTGGNAIANVYIYDIAGNAWQAGASLPTAVNFPAGTVIGRRLWVIGGGDPLGPGAAPDQTDSVNATQIYSAGSNSWSPGPTISQARTFMDAVTLNTSAGELALIVGGLSNGASTPTVETNTVSCQGGLLIGSALSLGYAPNHYEVLAGNFASYAFFNGQGAMSDFAIFQTHDPWGATILKDAIPTNMTYTVFTPSQLAGFNFNNYRVVVLNFDDHLISDFSPYYANALPALERYVRLGGVVWVQGSIQGVAGNKFAMPFGGMESFDLSDSDFVADEGSYLVYGQPNPITGNHASDGSYSGLPDGSRVVVKKTDANGPPVVYERRLLGGVVYDRNHDLKTDRTVFRPSTGIWYSALSDGTASAVGWGVSGDVDVMGDYDDDGIADIAVFRPSTGTWLIVQSWTGTVRADTWGTSGDIPMAGDFDADGKDDLVIYRPSVGTWFIKLSTGGSSAVGWGVSTDQPFVADFNSDGKADLVVYRPSTGAWFISYTGIGGFSIGWGIAGDIPVVADFDGDGEANLGVFRPSIGTWLVLTNVGIKLVTWGTSGDVPVSGDWDGDGLADFTVWRPTTGVWFTQFTSGGSAAVGWGVSGDKVIGRAPGF